MKKSFKGENPALQFITAAQQDTTAQQNTQHGEVTQHTQYTQRERQKMQPARAEVKSARMNLVLQPSLAEALKQLATMHRTSVNSLIHQTLQARVEAEAETIAQYNAIFERTKDNA